MQVTFGRSTHDDDVIVDEPIKVFEFDWVFFKRVGKGEIIVFFEQREEVWMTRLKSFIVENSQNLAAGGQSQQEEEDKEKPHILRLN